MKKKLAALLCGVMCVGAFSGCSTDELGYLKMAANAMDTMKTCEVRERCRRISTLMHRRRL